MKQTDFSNIELSFSEKITLRLIPVLKSEIWYKKDVLKRLMQLGFVRRYGTSKRGNTLYKRLPDGSMYFRLKRKSFYRFLIPTVISIISLLSSYDVLQIKPLYELLQAVSKLLKTIMENLGIS